MYDLRMESWIVCLMRNNLINNLNLNRVFKKVGGSNRIEKAHSLYHHYGITFTSVFRRKKCCLWKDHIFNFAKNYNLNKPKLAKQAH